MEHHVDFTFSGRYFTHGDKTTATQLWFVLHGYGQLAQYFIRKFRALEQQNIYVVAPEGLSRFYLEDISQRLLSGNNRVGATWMTREDRLTDIRNYNTFLNTVFEKEFIEGAQITVLGFSQGAATASRWASEGTIAFDRLILWGGMLPPDFELPRQMEVLTRKEIIFVKGLDDPFVTDERYAAMNQLSSKLGITPQVVEYKGGHDIDETTLLNIA